MRCKGDWHSFHISAYTCECRRYKITVEPTRTATDAEREREREGQRLARQLVEQMKNKTTEEEPN